MSIDSIHQISDILLNNKEWIFSGMGVFFFASIITFVKIFFKQKRHRGLSKFLGLYDVFVPKLDGSNNYIRSTMKISKNFGVYNVKIDMPYFSYTGTLSCKGNIIYLELIGSKQDTNLYIIFYEPLASFDILIGCFSGVTKNRNPVCGRIAAVRSVLKIQTYPSFIGQRDLPNGLDKVLRLTPTATIVVDPTSSDYLDKIK